MSRRHVVVRTERQRAPFTALIDVSEKNLFFSKGLISPSAHAKTITSIMAAKKSLKFKTRVGVLEKLKTRYLKVPAKVIKAFGGSFKQRFVVNVNGKVTFQT